MFLLLLLNFSFHQLDTTHVYQQQEVVVTATRTPISSVDAPSRVTRFDVSEMQDAGFNDTKSMLSFVDGIFVNDHGPAQIGTVCLRGTAADQTLFLFDGVSLNNVQNGVVDLFLVPTNDLSSIEISQGGSSALYGANAVGGVISLESKMPSTNLIRLDLGDGSYGGQMIGGEVGEGFGPIRIDLTAQRQRGINDFNFVFNDETQDFPMKFSGADYLDDSQSFQIAFPSSIGNTSFLIQNVSANRGTPYALTDSTFDMTDRESDQNIMALLKNTGSLGHFDYSTSAGFIYSYLKYTDPLYATDDYYKMLSVQPALQISQLENRLSAMLGIDAEFDRGYSDNMIGTKVRNRIGMFASAEYDLRNESDLETRLFGALRYDDYSQFGSSLNPKAGINVKPLAEFPINLRANVGTSFRVPTFDDLYYSSPYYNGNPSLKPERATDYDLGTVVELDENHFPVHGDLDLDYYQIDMRDGIVYQELTEFTSTEANLQKIISRGMELSMDANYKSLISLRANYFFGRSFDASNPGSTNYEKQLVYIPREQSSLLVEITPGTLTLMAAVKYVGERFYTADNAVSLEPFAVTSVSASARIDVDTFAILPKASVDNLFNREYQVVYQYPMPGRTYRLGVSLQFNQGK
jgi:outer membrane cobalamin receptor